MREEPRHPIVVNWRAAKVGALIGGVSAAFICFAVARTGISVSVAISLSMTVFGGIVGAIEQ